MENGKTITPFHILIVAMVKFRETTYGLVHYLPYSPDLALAPSDFYITLSLLTNREVITVVDVTVDRGYVEN